MSVSYIKPIPTHEKILAVGKSGPNATFNPFPWVGLALGWGVRRFHNKNLGWPWVWEFVGFMIKIYMFSNPTEFGISQNTLRIDIKLVSVYRSVLARRQTGASYG